MADAPAAGKLWGGRFSGATDPLMTAYNESIHFDRALYAHDIAGSVAFARANVATGVLTPDEFAAIERGLGQVRAEWEAGTFKIVGGVDEDIHTANERRLGELIGSETAGKLHTGRSRNDQVATDLRLWLRDRLAALDAALVALLATTADRAEAELDVLMPGYTHLQRAQPVRWSHFLLAHATGWLDDLDRLRQLAARVNRCPLGAGALAGNAFEVDREAMAAELGFAGLMGNSMAAVGDRDYALETLQWASMLMVHVSRWAEDLIVYGSAEFGFVRLADAYSTGSSLMPQKKNSDSLELLRGKSGRVFGAMAGLMMSVKGLPSTYNKDLQESVEPLFETVRSTTDSLAIAARVLATLSISPDRMRAALTPDMLATDLADHLVRRGVPFRQTHSIAGRVVARAEREARPLDSFSVAELREVDPRFGDDVSAVFDYEVAVERRSAAGGTAKQAVREQIAQLRARLGSSVDAMRA